MALPQRGVCTGLTHSECYQKIKRTNGVVWDRGWDTRWERESLVSRLFAIWLNIMVMLVHFWCCWSGFPRHVELLCAVMIASDHHESGVHSGFTVWSPWWSRGSLAVWCGEPVDLGGRSWHSSWCMREASGREPGWISASEGPGPV